MTSTTTLPAHTTWCAKHEPNDDVIGLAGFCQSRFVLAGGMYVGLVSMPNAPGEAYVEIGHAPGRGGDPLEMALEDLPALREALGLVSDVLEGHCVMPTRGTVLP